MTEFKVGDKVVPISKSISSSLEHSTVWKRAKLANQPYLYIVEIYGETFTCNEVSDYLEGDYVEGDYFKEEDLKHYQPKPTKNQRITALEKTVASLTEQLQALQQQVNERFEPSTVVVAVDGDTSALAEVIEETPVKTANELRAEVIEKAEWFVESAIERGRDSDARKGDVGNETYKEYFYTIEFFTKENKVTALVTRTNREGEKLKRHPDHVGRAKCMPGDVFNEHIGKAIALGRALGLDVSEFENAVQPTVAVGQIVSSLYEFNLEENGTISTVECLTEDGFPYHNNGWSSHYKIINDTNAQYEVK